MAARPPKPSPEEAIVLALFDLTNQLTKLGEAITARAGITPQQWMVLLQVAGDPNFEARGRARASRRQTLASDIAADRGVSRAHISALVAGLRRRGLVQQVEHAGDRRRKHLELTGAGRRVIAQLDRGRRRANRALLADLTPAGRRAMLATLHACLRRLWVDSDKGRPAQKPPISASVSGG
jgi:DNA-binding MarR family transcriptional regulator